MPILPSPTSLRQAVRATVAALVLLPTTAQAQFFDGRPGWAIARAGMQVCGSDVARLCGGVTPGGGRITQCLSSQPDKLSPECQRFVAQTRSARSAVFACTADAQRLCAGTLPGAGRIVACLNNQRDALSATCAKALDEAAALGR